jgi:hypothetical protein
MPRIPMPPTDDGAYKKNTSEQYEALGRFVEAFEAIVNELRESCIYLLVSDDPRGRLADVAFHHPALSAKPLWDIFRALVVEYIDQPEIRITAKDREAFLGVLKVIDTEYQALVNKRNILLHGAWFIGYPSFDDPDSKLFSVRKFKPTKTGLTKEETPKDAAELLRLRDRCKKLRDWISWLFACLPADGLGQTFAERFVFKEGSWQIILGGEAETLQ